MNRTSILSDEMVEQESVKGNSLRRRYFLLLSELDITPLSTKTDNLFDFFIYGIISRDY